jgi:hypothetical protein
VDPPDPLYRGRNQPLVRPRSVLPEWPQSRGNLGGRFQSRSGEKVSFVSTWPENETTSASFLSPGRKKKSNPRVPPYGSNPTLRLLQHEASSNARWRDAALAAREASKWRREVAAWLREVTAWRRESSPTSSSRTASTNSASDFSPVSAFGPPSALSFFPLSFRRR